MGGVKKWIGIVQGNRKIKVRNRSFGRIERIDHLEVNKTNNEEEHFKEKDIKKYIGISIDCSKWVPYKNKAAKKWYTIERSSKKWLGHDRRVKEIR